MLWERKNIFLIGKSLVIGIVASLSAVAYRGALQGAELLRQEIFAFSDSWLFVVLLFLFLLVVGLITGRITESEPLIKGSGIPQVEGQFYGHFSPRPLAVLVKKFVAGALSMVCGLSLGREGPSIQLGAMAGQLVGDRLPGTDEDDKKTAFALRSLCRSCLGL